MKPPKKQKAQECGSVEQALAWLAKNGVLTTEAGLKQLRAEMPDTIFIHSRWQMHLILPHADKLPPPEDIEGLEAKEILERRKIRAQYLKEEFRLAVEQRKYVPIEEVQRDLIRIGAGLRSELLRFMGDVPNWEGIPAAEMSVRARKCFDTLCRNLADETSKLYA